MSWLVPWRRRGEVHPLAGLQDEVNRLFDSVWRGDLTLGDVFRRGWAPALDVAETDEAVVVKAEVPGIDAKDLEVTVTGAVLTIKGEKREEKEEKDKRHHRVERAYGAFSRSVDLPEEVDAEKIQAECKDGVLTVTMPKKPEAKGRRITIDVK